MSANLHSRLHGKPRAAVTVKLPSATLGWVHSCSCYSMLQGKPGKR